MKTIPHSSIYKRTWKIHFLMRVKIIEKALSNTPAI